MAVTQVPPPQPWIQPDGSPTFHFFKFITNLFNATSAAGAANNTIWANISGTSAGPVANTLTNILDSIVGNTRGDIISRGATSWAALALGTTGKALVSDGTDVLYALVASLASTVTLASAAPAIITTAGGDLKLDSATHTLQLGTTMAVATVPASFSATRILAIKDGSGTTFYVPAATAVW